MSKNNTHKKIFPGLVLIIIGAALLLRNLNLVPALIPDYIFTWPMILIVIGVFDLASRADKTSGFILIAIGLFFLLPNALGIPTREVFKFWPLLLIIAGLSFLKKKQYYERPNPSFRTPSDRNYSGPSGISSSIDESSFFSNNQKVLDPIEFKGGNISSVFGGNEIDLSRCTLGEGNNVLTLNVLFGGVVVFVPADWHVQFDVKPILGGFNDNRWNNPNDIKDTRGTLTIKGTLLFGGGEIRNR